MSSFVLNSLKEGQETLNKFVSNPTNVGAIESAVKQMVQTLKSGGRILSCGNGGSLCDSMHFAEELTGRYRKDRAPLAAMSLTDPSHMSCVANDFGYDFVFSRLVEAWGRQGDVLLAISTSGNSENVIKATIEAKKCGMKVVGLLGKTGGKLKEMVDVAIIVDSAITDRIQEVHIKCIHIMIEGIERSLYPDHYTQV